MFLHMNIRTFVTILSRKAQCNFPKMRGGSKAVWNFSENSSDLVHVTCPYVVGATFRGILLDDFPGPVPLVASLDQVQALPHLRPRGAPRQHSALVDP